MAKKEADEKPKKKKRKRGHGEGYIGQRQDGRWMAQVTIGHDSEGKPKRVTYYGKTRGEVQEKMDNAKTEIRTGTFAEPSKGTFGEWILRWLEVYKRPNFRASTYGNFEFIIKSQIIPGLGDIKLQALKPDDLQDYYNQKSKDGRLDGGGGLSSSVIRLYHKIIKSCLEQAVKNRLITYNPASVVILPKMVGRQLNVLNREQMKKYLNTAKGERFYPAFLIELSTGLRKGELMALRWQDIDFEERTLTVCQNLSRVRLPDEKKTALVFEEPKTEKGKRVIPVLPKVVFELKSLKAKQNERKIFLGEAYKDQGLIFTNPIGMPVDPLTLFYAHKRVLTKAKLPNISFHTLRHSFATLLVEEGEDPKILQEILGHANISTTYDIYVKVTNNTKAKALKKIEGLLG